MSIVYAVPGCRPGIVALVPVTRWTGSGPATQAAYCTTATLSVEGFQATATLV